MAGEVLIVRTGIANVASVRAGLRRVGAETRLTEDPSEVRDAAHVFLPGVGAFGAGMKRLTELGLVDPIRARIEAGASTLAICLGLQLLCEGSEESPGVEGLGVVPARIERFPDDVVVPHFGWNQVEPDEGGRFVESGYAYYANSYRLTEAPEGWNVAWTDHGGRFVGAMERGDVLACQFHPELSGLWGIELLKRWLAT